MTRTLSYDEKPGIQAVATTTGLVAGRAGDPPTYPQRLAAAALGWRARRRLASSPKRSSLDPKIGWNEGMKRAKIAKVKFSWSFPLSQQMERSTVSA